MTTRAHRSHASSFSPLLALALSLAAACAPGSPAPNVTCVADADCFTGGICTGFGVCRLGEKVDPGKSTIAVSHPVAIADGNEAILVTVTLKDAAGKPLADRGVFIAVDGDATFTEPALATDGNGQAVGSFTSTKAEVKTLHAFGSVQVGATAAGKGIALTATATVEFRGNPGGISNPDGGSPDGGGTIPGTTLTVTSESGGAPNVVADGKAKIQLRALLRDSSGNPVPNVPVFIDVIGSSTTTTSSGNATAADGTFTASVVSTKAEQKTLIFTAGTVHLNSKITFHAGQADSAHCHVAANKDHLLATGTPKDQATITIVAADLYGNPTPAVPVWIETETLDHEGAPTSTSDQGTTDPSAQEKDPALTGADGTVQIKYAAAKAEVKRLVIHVDAAATVVLAPDITIDHGPASPASSLFKIIGNDDGSPIVADGQQFYGLVAYIADENDNPIAGESVAFKSDRGGIDSLSPNAGQNGTSTQADGTYIVLLSSQEAGHATITCSLQSIGDAQDDVDFVAGPPVLAKSTIGVPTRAHPTTDPGSNTVHITVGLFDQFSNPVNGAPVSIDASGTGNTFTAPTLGNGTYEVDLSSGKAEVKTITASVDLGGTLGVLQLAPKTVTFSPGAVDAVASTLELGNTVSPIADSVDLAGVRVTLLDHQGNPIPGITVIPTVTTSSKISLLKVDGPTDAAGQAIVTFVSSAAETKTVSISAAGAALVDKAAILFVNGPATAGAPTTFTAAPATIDAGGVATLLTIVVKDAPGNPVPNFSLGLGSSAAAGTFTFTPGTTIVTDATGTATVKYTSTVMGAQTITASGTTSAGAFTKTTPVTIGAGTPSAANSTVAAAPASATADNNAAITLTVTEKNTNGSLISGHNLTFASSPAGLTIAQGSTNASGVATTTVKSAVTGTYVVTATDASASPAVAVGTVNVTFTAGAPASGPSTLTASPASIISGGTSTTLTLTVKDAQGNLVPNSSFTMGTDQALGAFSPSATVVTNANGVATVSYSSSTQSTANITANNTLGIFRQITVSVVAGSVSTKNSSLAASPSSAPVGTVPTTNFITFTVTEISNTSQPIVGRNISFSASPANLTFSGTGSIVTNTSGQGSLTAISSTSGTFTVTAFDTAVGANVASTTVTFTAGAATAGTSTITASPSSFDAGNPNGSTVTLVVKDQFNNPVPNVDISMESNGAPSTFAFTPAAMIKTDATGTATVKYTSTQVLTQTLTAKVGGATFKTVAVNVTAGTYSAAKSSITFAPASAVVNSAGITVTITELNTNGAAMSGQKIALASSQASTTSITGSGNSTNAAGVVTMTVQSSLAAGITLSASDVTATSPGPVFAQGVATFTAAAANAANSSLALSATQSVADNSTTVTLTATVQDANKNLVPNVAVNFKSDDLNDDTFSCPAGAAGCALAGDGSLNTTTAAGVATGLVVSKKSGLRTYTATVGGFTKTGQVTYLAGVAAKLVFAQQPSDVVAGSIIAPSVKVKLVDQFGNDAPQSTARITVAITPVGSGATGTLTGASAVDTQGGVATFNTIAATGAAGPRTLVASAPNLASVTSNTIGGVSAAPSFTILVPNASTGVDGDFVANADISMEAKTWNFKSVTIAAGARVVSGGLNLLEIRASGPVVINGILDASGANGGSVANANGGGGGGGNGGRSTGGGTNGVPGTAVNATGGSANSVSVWGKAGGNGGGGRPGLGGGAIGGGGAGGNGAAPNVYSAGGGGGGGGGGGVGGGAGGDGGNAVGGAGGGDWGGKMTNPRVDAQGGGAACAGDANRSMYVGGTGSIGRPGCPVGGSGAGGSIGCDAAADVAMSSTFRPGSGGGGAGSGIDWASGGGGGGGGGGALKVFSVVSITVGPSGAVLANGGAGGRATFFKDGCYDSGGGGGGGSGGAIWLQAPTLAIPAGAKVQAVGGAGGAAGAPVAQPALGGNGGLGRIRFSIDPALSSIAGAVSPPPTAGVTPSAVKPGNAFVSIYPQ